MSHLQRKRNVAGVVVGDGLVRTVIVIAECGDCSCFRQVRVDLIEVQDGFVLACARIVDDPVIGTASYRHPRDEQASGFKTDLNRLWMFDSAVIGAFSCKGSDFCSPVCQRKRMGAACLSAVRI